MEIIGYYVIFTNEGLTDAKTFWINEHGDAEAEAERFGGAQDSYLVVDIVATEVMTLKEIFGD